MKVVVDLNLPPRWVDFLVEHGMPAVHWSSVGDLRATDSTIMAWARDTKHLVLTSDLDFSTLLALTGARGPSVVQLRAQDVLPEATGEHVLNVLREHAHVLATGAVISVDEITARVRILPLSHEPA